MGLELCIQSKGVGVALGKYRVSRMAFELCSVAVALFPVTSHSKLKAQYHSRKSSEGISNTCVRGRNTFCVYPWFTVEPLNKGHFGSRAFVLISEVVLVWEV